MTNRYICIDGIDDVHVHVTIWEIPTYACAHKHVYTHSVRERERECVCVCVCERREDPTARDAATATALQVP